MTRPPTSERQTMTQNIEPPVPGRLLSRLAHRIGGMVALMIISTFMLTTLWSELWGTHDQVVAVKTAIPWGLLVLIPALMATGISGTRLTHGRKGGSIAVKMIRMKIIAGNGLLVLVPSALILAALAREAPSFGALFYTVQGVELLAGALNITLITRNIRDGLRLSRARRRTR